MFPMANSTPSMSLSHSDGTVNLSGEEDVSIHNDISDMPITEEESGGSGGSGGSGPCEECFNENDCSAGLVCNGIMCLENKPDSLSKCIKFLSTIRNAGGLKDCEKCSTDSECEHNMCMNNFCVRPTWEGVHKWTRCEENNPQDFGSNPTCHLCRKCIEGDSCHPTKMCHEGFCVNEAYEVNICKEVPSNVPMEVSDAVQCLKPACSQCDSHAECATYMCKDKQCFDMSVPCLSKA